MVMPALLFNAKNDIMTENKPISGFTPLFFRRLLKMPVINHHKSRQEQERPVNSLAFCFIIAKLPSSHFIFEMKYIIEVNQNEE
jgi:hypothetical protein